MNPQLCTTASADPIDITSSRFVDKVLFFLLFSGPPKFRLRDPNASLDIAIDWVVMLHIIVWVVAGLWVFNKLWLSKLHFGTKISSLEKVSMFFVACLSVSIVFSDGPALTAFKIYQLFITITFLFVYSRDYGVQACFDGIYFGSAALCIADVLAAIFAPSMVFGESEFGSLRFRGDLIAQTGIVGALALVLLLTSSHKRSGWATAVGGALFGSVLLFSLMRTAYLAFVVFLLLALWKKPEIRLLKRIARFAALVLPVAVIVGALAQLEEYRPAESIWTLSDRLGLWTYLVDIMWSTSRWFGLGYFSASRIYGPEYNPGLGTAHSVFIEVLAGGGVVSFTVLLILVTMLIRQSLRLLQQVASPTNFIAVGLLVLTLSFLLVGGELEAEPAGFTFWTLVVTIPILVRSSSKTPALSAWIPSQTK